MRQEERERTVLSMDLATEIPGHMRAALLSPIWPIWHTTHSITQDKLTLGLASRMSHHLMLLSTAIQAWSY